VSNARREKPKFAGEQVTPDTHSTEHGAFVNYLSTPVLLDGKPADYIKFEVCETGKIEERSVDNRLGYQGGQGIYVSRDCPYEEGWGFATRRMGRAPRVYDRAPYYFLRIPIGQFEQIGDYKVSGSWADKAFGSSKPHEYYNNTKAAYQTKGWTVNVKEGNTMDGYVYCKYLPLSFPSLER
jgi:hypothetical protein